MIKFDSTTSTEKSQLTKELLNSIANHLSGRKDCKGVNYVVTIHHPHSTLTIVPNIQVLPNRYRRCERDKVSVLVHVIQEHMTELFVGFDSQMNLVVESDMLVPGTYVYESSIDGKRRRWNRLK